MAEETASAPWQRKLRERLAELDKARASIISNAAPMRKRREEAQKQIEPLEAKVRDLSKEINAIERPALVDIDNERASIHRSFGAKSLRAE